MGGGHERAAAAGKKPKQATENESAMTRDTSGTGVPSESPSESPARRGQLELEIEIGDGDGDGPVTGTARDWGAAALSLRHCSLTGSESPPLRQLWSDRRGSDDSESGVRLVGFHPGHDPAIQ